MEKNVKILKNEIVERADITIILNIWKRNYFEEQIMAILKQSILPREIWVIHYENHVDIQDILKGLEDVFEDIVQIKSSKNLKYFGRFSLAINIKTEFLWIIDDDVIPGTNYLKNCLENCIAFNSIISCAGRVIPKNNFRPELTRDSDFKTVFIGDVNRWKKYNHCSTNKKVDYGCQSYFLKRDWLRIFWSIWPVTFMSGEDIHLSATCKSQIGIDTIVLKQSDLSTSGNIKKKYGRDGVASWKKSDFIEIREKVIEFHILKNKWKPILW